LSLRHFPDAQAIRLNQCFPRATPTGEKLRAVWSCKKDFFAYGKCWKEGMEFGMVRIFEQVGDNTFAQRAKMAEWPSM